MKYLHEIEKNAARQPASPAIACSTGASLSYGELWAASEAIAAHIDGAALPAHEPVVVYGHKSPLMIACFLGCLKSGHPYVPVDTHSVPGERVKSIVAQIGNPLVFDFGGGFSSRRIRVA